MFEKVNAAPLAKGYCRIPAVIIYFRKSVVLILRGYFESISCLEEYCHYMPISYSY
jgi:hypothetical protein